MRADELNVQFTLPEPPDTALAAWKASPPEPFEGFEIVDDAYNSLTFEQRFMDWPMKLTKVLSLGLLGNMGESIWRATVRFDPGDHGSRVTVVGMLDEQTRAALGRWAAERGRIVQDWGLPTAP